MDVTLVGLIANMSSLVQSKVSTEQSLRLAVWLRLGGPLLIALVWIVLYLPRPLKLGFYADDWVTIVKTCSETAPLSPARLARFVGPGGTLIARPAAGLILFALSTVCGTSAFAWQLSSILFCLAAALSLRRWLLELWDAVVGPRSDPSGLQIHPADWAAAAWLSWPFMLGLVAWPVAGHALLSQICLTEAARDLVRPHRNPWRFLLLVFLSLSIYENLYFQIFLIIPVVWMFSAGGFRSVDAWRAGALSGAAHLLAVGVNRLIPHVFPGATGLKHFVPSWPHFMWLSLRALPDLLVYTLREVQRACLYSCGVLAVLSLLFLLSGLRRRPRLAWLSAAFIVLACAAIVVSAATIAMAGYNFQANGLNSRLMYGPSWACALGFFALVAPFQMFPTSRWRYLGYTAAGAVIFASGIAQTIRLRDWAEASRQQAAILETAPIGQITSLPPGSRILFVGPSYYKDVIIFAANYDLMPAVAARVASLGGTPGAEISPLHAATDEYLWTWDGTELILECPPKRWFMRFPATQLYLWRYPGTQLTRVEKGFRYCGATCRDLLAGK